MLSNGRKIGKDNLALLCNLLILHTDELESFGLADSVAGVVPSFSTPLEISVHQGLLKIIHMGLKHSLLLLTSFFENVLL